MVIYPQDFHTSRDLLISLEEIAADPRSLPFFDSRRKMLTVRLLRVDYRAANALKQEMLSRGGDVAVHRNVIDGKIDRSDAIIFGTKKQYHLLLDKLAIMPPCWGIPEIRSELKKVLDGLAKRKWTLRLPRNRKLSLGDSTTIMGIMNINEDSFFPNSRISKQEEIAKRAKHMVDQGAIILDLGAESTRPGACPISQEEELERIIPAIRTVRSILPDVIISVDTYKSSVARESVMAGADIINDISGLGADRQMASTVAKLEVPVVIMHIKGTPRDMQEDPTYENLLGEMNTYFAERIELAVATGIDRSQIILDPGLGFGKRTSDNLTILKHIEAFRAFGLPLLIGHSRKGTIERVLELENPADRLEGTVAISSLCAMQEVEIVRVHDVLENSMATRMIDAIRRAI